MKRLFVPSWGPSDWRRLLANPSTQWVRGKSAFELAVAWEAARNTDRGLPPSVATLLDAHELTRGARLLLALPEFQVEFPGGGHHSQTDLWALLRSDTGLISLAVEAKSGEALDSPVDIWLKDAKPNSGKPARLAKLREVLNLSDADLGHIRYQLLHRAASAIRMAEDFGASVAVLIVQSFGGERDASSRTDFAHFIDLMSCPSGSGLLAAGRTTCVPLFVSWLECRPALESTLGDAV